MSHVCKKCGEPKLADEMSTRQGKVLATCKACWGAALSVGHAGGGKAVTSRPKDTQRTQVSERARLPALSIEPGHGLTAHIHDGYLQMQQSDDERTDTLMLSKSEAKALFASFADWAAS